ncbi:MAG: hypothetical protein ACRDTS_24205, partial [Mycobacterium sp.]
MIRKIAVAFAASGAVGALALGGVALGGTAHAAATIGATVKAYGTGSTATWDPAGMVATLSSGSGTGASAQVNLVNPPAPSAAHAPTMTASSASAGDPRWVIEFHNGDYLFGQLTNGSTPQSTLSWSLEPGGTPESSWAAALGAVQAGGGDDQVTAAFIVDDAGYAGTTVQVSNITYNGEAVVRYVRPYLYDGHVITVSNNRAEIGWKDGPGVHYVLTRTFGYGFSPNGSPHIGFTGITTGYWAGLAAGHTYDIELIPAGANRQPLPNAQVGWIN